MITDAAILLIEYFTEESNGFMTASSIRKKLRSILGLRIHAKTIAKYRHIYLGKICVFKKIILVYNDYVCNIKKFNLVIIYYIERNNF